ncbi:MAG: hypothetical protein ACFKPT_10885 [Gloeotrichia echinulata GP01]|jgi:hypothetical protein|nr:hypothetical protein [Gloeotrichia echinulata DEX184]
MLSNSSLIEEFVRDSIDKKEVLLSNTSLTAEMVYDTNQLIAKKEGVIATKKLTNKISEFWINSNSSYRDLMNEALAKFGYVFTAEIDQRGFCKYQSCSVPKGYTMQCTKSVLLWQTWWKYRKYPLRLGIPLEVLIQTRDSWYGIKDLTISDGLFYIKTLVNEVVFHAEDMVIWLSRIESNPKL